MSIEEALAAVVGHHTQWRQEKRAGVDHYVTGQHRARRFEDEDGDGVILAFAPADGHKISVLVYVREDAGWYPVDRIDMHSFGPQRRPIPGDFELSERMLEVMDEAWSA